MEKEYYFNSTIPPPLQIPNNLSQLDSNSDGFAIRELLITKLGTPHKTYISPDISYINSFIPKIQVPKEDLRNSINSAMPELPTDPGFAERAAKFSCFGSRSFNGRSTSQLGLKTMNNNAAEFRYHSSGLGMENLTRVASSPSLNLLGSPPPMGIIQTQMEMLRSTTTASASAACDRKFSNFSVNSNEESSVSGQNPSGDNGLVSSNELNSRKRKGVSRGKARENALKETEGVKRSRNNGEVKREEERKDDEDKRKASSNNQKPPEPPKDYIHVRARRGQATDSHSLAERVRREKIGERMKLLQDLVPGCNKVTGKALMLDEIINYVQSLQRQVEFLSMKLANVNPRLEVNMDNLLANSKDIFQPNVTMSHQMYPVDASTSSYNYSNQSNQNSRIGKPVESLDVTHCRNITMPPLGGFGEILPQFPAFSEDDLQSIVQMGFWHKPDIPHEN